MLFINNVLISYILTSQSVVYLRKHFIFLIYLYYILTLFELFVLFFCKISVYNFFRGLLIFFGWPIYRLKLSYKFCIMEKQVYSFNLKNLTKKNSLILLIKIN